MSIHQDNRLNSQHESSDCSDSRPAHDAARSGADEFIGDEFIGDDLGERARG
jgi:hypothetical protein